MSLEFDVCFCTLSILIFSLFGDERATISPAMCSGRMRLPYMLRVGGVAVLPLCSLCPIHLSCYISLLSCGCTCSTRDKLSSTK